MCFICVITNFLGCFFFIYHLGPHTFCGISSLHYRSGIKLQFAGTGSQQMAITASGLYVISSTVMSNSGPAYYYVLKNNDRLSVCYVRDRSLNILSSHTCTSTITAHLDAGDRVSVQTGTSMEVYGSGTCLTITKIN